MDIEVFIILKRESFYTLNGDHSYKVKKTSSLAV